MIINLKNAGESKEKKMGINVGEYISLSLLDSDSFEGKVAHIENSAITLKDMIFISNAYSSMVSVDSSNALAAMEESFNLDDVYEIEKIPYEHYIKSDYEKKYEKLDVLAKYLSADREGIKPQVNLMNKFRDELRRWPYSHYHLTFNCGSRRFLVYGEEERKDLMEYSKDRDYFNTTYYVSGRQGLDTYEFIFPDLNTETKAGDYYIYEYAKKGRINYENC